MTFGKKIPLVGRLQERIIKVKREVDKPVPSPDNDLYFRASSLPYECPRAHYLIKQVTGLWPRKQEEFDADTCWRFAYGTIVHDALQNQIMPLVGHVFQGWWFCEECLTQHRGEPMDGPISHGWIPQPDECRECGHNELRYQELYIKDDEYRLTGHIDGVLVWSLEDPSLEDELCDFKTHDPRWFHYRDPAQGGGPMDTHVYQLSTYMWEAGFKRGRLVYLPKHPDPSEVLHSIVEHVVELDPVMVSGTKRMLESYLAGEEPTRPPDCTSRACKRAKKCKASKFCW